MRTGLTVSAILLCLAAFAMTGLPDAFGQTQPDESGQSRLLELLNKRRDILAKAAELRMQEYRQGECGFEDVLTAQQQLQEAELDAANSSEGRIAALGKQLKIAESGVALAEQRFRVGGASQVVVLQARAASFGVEIKLLRERGSKDN